MWTRFDFGVPLEDISPPYDIHPRLKYLLGKAFESYKEHGCNIENILRYGQGTLNERLLIKDKLILALDYHMNVDDYSPGAYFWVIRHFVGLLPLPVLPNYAGGIHFYWKFVAEECQTVFKSHDRHERSILDYDIASALNMLPLEHLVILNAIIHFLRKIVIRKVRGKHRVDRPSLFALINYYCTSLFVRPFIPRYCNKSEYHPLLLYLILRWKNITKILSADHPTCLFNSEPNLSQWQHAVITKNNYYQSSLKSYSSFNPEMITVSNNIPYLVPFYKFLKDNASQTETDLCKEDDSTETKEFELMKKRDTGAYKLAFIEELDEDIQEAGNDDDFEDNNSLYQTAEGFIFNSSLDEEIKQDWKDIVSETMETVKKIEGSYIYDDYETFQREEYNQIAKNRTGSFLSKISRYGLTPSSLKIKPTKEVLKSSTPKKDSPDSENSYVKYSDVCSSDSSQEEINQSDYSDDKNRDLDEIKITDHSIAEESFRKPSIPIAQKLFQGDSPISIEEDDSKKGLQGESVKKKSTRKYILKRIRISLSFLRTLTPRKSTFKTIESKIKYCRIINQKNGKAHTI